MFDVMREVKAVTLPAHGRAPTLTNIVAHTFTPVRASTTQSPWPPHEQSVSAHDGPVQPGSQVHVFSASE